MLAMPAPDKIRAYAATVIRKNELRRLNSLTCDSDSIRLVNIGSSSLLPVPFGSRSCEVRQPNLKIGSKARLCNLVLSALCFVLCALITESASGYFEESQYRVQSRKYEAPSTKYKAQDKLRLRRCHSSGFQLG